MAINNKRNNKWLVCFAAALFLFYEFIQLMMFDSLNLALRQAFAINAAQVGLLAAMSLYANVILLFPAGILLDRFSTRKLILITLSLCVIGTFIFAAATTFEVAAFARFLAGIGSAFCFLSAVRIASRWFPSKQLALAIGLVVTLAMLGGMVAQTPITLLAQHYGWRTAVFWDGVLGIIILVIVFLYVKDYPPGYAIEHHRSHLRQIGFWRSLRLSFLRLQNWLAAIYTATLNFPVIILGAVWGVSYLERVDHIQATRASLITSMIFVGTIIGSPAIGWLSDRLGLRRLPMIIGAILALIVVLIIMYVPNLSWTALFILFGLLGFVTSSQVISYPLVTESNAPALTATSVSVISLTAQSSGAIFQPVFGWLLQLTSDVKFIKHTAIYSQHDFQRAMLILPIAFVIALIAAWRLRETYGRACINSHCEHSEAIQE